MTQTYTRIDTQQEYCDIFLKETITEAEESALLMAEMLHGDWFGKGSILDPYVLFKDKIVRPVGWINLSKSVLHGFIEQWGAQVQPDSVYTANIFIIGEAKEHRHRVAINSANDLIRSRGNVLALQMHQLRSLIRRSPCIKP